MIEAVSGNSGNDSHLWTVTENPDRWIGSVFLLENVRDCQRPRLLRHESPKVFRLSFDLQETNHHRNPQGRLRPNGSLFEDLLRRVGKDRQTKRKQDQSIARPDVGIVLRQIGKRDEAEVRKKEKCANQSVSHS